ncbi:hypothetical protein AB6A40_006674 [Gnathostoma spinigerum]|uniref:Peptide-N(4)-(N-acetyl-beta-glucosaminyl)asparagine amidase n=1 Tax=Gnathostoma spinigerum TaxID=75299 RepID=A0ABD6EUP5_9BILA
MVQTISDDFSLDGVLSEAGNKLVIIDFYADWCGPCRQIAPFIEEMSRKYEQVVFLKVNVDLCQQTSNRFEVEGVPTFLCIVNSQEVDRWVGANPETLERKIVECLQRNGSADPERIATPEERAFLQKYVQYVEMMDVYEDDVARTLAISLIPIDELKRQSQLNGVVNTFELVKNLLRWFKTEFFQWTDSPNCDFCGKPTMKGAVKSDLPTSEEEECGANRVELYRCDTCKQETRFPRYNDPTKLLETRCGRCGEWANCFTLCCRALDLETRWVHDESDHVWNEVWINELDRWVHCDPCENVIDTPLLYERGWGKKLSYVIAVSLDHVRDVTWRYTFDHLAVIKRRTICRESILRNFIRKLNARLERTLSEDRKKELDRRYINELVEFLSPNVQERSGSSSESQGRITGSKEWRQERGEMGDGVTRKPVILELSEQEKASKTFRLEYYCSRDEYVRGSEILKGWKTFVNDYKHVFRKVETDWNMSYLCREEGVSHGEISWVLDLNGLSAESIRIELNGMQKFEKGIVNAIVCCGDACNLLPENGILNLENVEGGHVEIKVMFSGDEGPLAWQHAQLFRTPLASSNPSMKLLIKLR